jgi:methylphosphotriester-DNA--protein-cysteine methyltransferase
MLHEEKVTALQQRDKTYNGKFFVAVKTTGIVCLPSCCGRPLLKNVVFYDNYEDAIHDGYRPCKRCKPDVFVRENAK